MDIAGVANVATALSQARVGDAVAIAVLRKALDIQAEGALQLLEALPQAAAGNPPHLGNQVNTFA